MLPFTGMTLEFDLRTLPAAESPEARPALGRLGWTVALLIGAQLALRLGFGYGTSAYFPPGRTLPLDWTEAEKLLVGMVNLHGMADLLVCLGLVGSLALLVTTRRTPAVLLGLVGLASAAHAVAGLYLARTWVPEHLAGMNAEQLARLPLALPGNLAWMGVTCLALTTALLAVVLVQHRGSGR